MLTHIHIKNFTIVSELNLDFHPGLNVLTGETGAGKSIWVDAVQMALGHRADPNLIRPSKDHCDITLSFDINNNHQAKMWLENNNFNSEECIIRRMIYANRSSRSTINGTPCPQHLIRDLSSHLMAIHGQHQHLTLLSAEGQRERLDQFANNLSLVKNIYNYYQEWLVINKKIDSLQLQAKNRADELVLLEYQYEELTSIALQEHEWDELSRQHQRLYNAKKLINELNQAIDLTTDNEEISALQLAQQAIHHLEMACKHEPQLLASKELLETATIHLQEASNELNQYRNDFDLSSENLDIIEKRLTIIHDLSRKHHVNPKDLHDVEKSLSQKITRLKNIDSEIAELNQKQKEIESSFQKEANQLSKKREHTAKELSQTITDMIKELGMKDAQFEIRCEKLPHSIHPYGNETIRFEIITNRGQTFQPLNNIVSGGELSRIGLAIQVATATQDNVPTLIFDEVDTGIGGKTAAMVGKLLQLLGEKIQVLCITHLPQIAAKAHHHYKVEKITENTETFTKIIELDHENKIDELSRMLGGAKITEQTRAHASELLENSA